MTYSSSLAANRQRFNAKSQNITGFKEKYQTIGPVSNTIILLVLICVLGLLYLSQATKTNAYSYQLNDLKEQKAVLESERSQLEIDSARLKSMARVKNGEAVRDFVSVAPTAVVRE
jgi:hypothetical protein